MISAAALTAMRILRLNMMMMMMMMTLLASVQLSVSQLPAVRLQVGFLPHVARFTLARWV